MISSRPLRYALDKSRLKLLRDCFWPGDSFAEQADADRKQLTIKHTNKTV